MAITVDFSSLTKYSDQVQMPLMRLAILPPTLLDTGFTVQEDVTYISKLNVFTNTLVTQAGGVCGAFSATGGGALTQRDASVKAIKWENEWCDRDFKNYWTKQITKKGNYGDVTPDQFNELYSALLAEQIQVAVEENWFCGTTTGTASCGFYNAGLTKVDGILHQAYLTSDSSSIVRFGASYSGNWTSTNAKDIVYDAISKIPVDMQGLEDNILCVNFTSFIALQQAIVNANYTPVYLNDGGNIAQNGNTILNPFGLPIKVKWFRGLRHTTKAFLTPASNLYILTDLVSDFSKFRTWYSDDAGGVVRYKVEGRLGAAMISPALFLHYNG